MFTLRFLLLWGLTALTACAQGVLDAHPEITAAPVVHELAKRDGGFIGANMVGVNQWHYSSCPRDEYYATDGQFGYCCGAANRTCLTATACSANTAVGPAGLTATCLPGDTCQTIRVVDSKGSFVTRTHILCANGARPPPATWYRATFAVSTSKGKITTVATARVPAATAMPNGGTAVAAQGRAATGLVAVAGVVLLVRLVL